MNYTTPRSVGTSLFRGAPIKPKTEKNLAVNNAERSIPASKKAVISLSGGLDSTMLLMWLLGNGYNEVRAYSFDYGQKHDVELKKVKNNIKFLKGKGYNIEHQIINVRDIFSDSASSLKQGGSDIPEGHYADDNMKSTVVENRNVIFSAIIYGKALGWANKTNSPVDITLGVHAGDHTIYPDCRPESIQMAAELYRISNWGSEKIHYIAPFIDASKGEVLQQGYYAMIVGMQLSIDEAKEVLRNTHTCYNPNSKGHSCGKCGSCTERLEAFASMNMEDPITYQEVKELNPETQETSE